MLLCGDQYSGARDAISSAPKGSDIYSIVERIARGLFEEGVSGSDLDRWVLAQRKLLSYFDFREIGKRGNPSAEFHDHIARFAYFESLHNPGRSEFDNWMDIVNSIIQNASSYGLTHRLAA